MKRLISLLIVFGFIQSSSSQELVDIDFLRSYSALEISVAIAFLAPGNTDQFSIDYDVDLYKIRYTSPDLNGEIDTLSGLLCSPRSEDLRHPTLVYCHGTVADRNAVPSRLSDEHLLGTLYASMGYYCLLPDYLGLGDSDGVHPYVHAESEASASYNMLHAFKQNEDEAGAITNDQIFLTGYSQGGHASMALHRYMESNTDVPYNVTAATHLSGPYSISEAMVDFTLGEEPYSFAAYLASVAISYEAAYGNILDDRGLASFFLPAYAAEMERFVNEEIDLFELNEILGEILEAEHGAIIPRNMIRDSMLNAILNDPNSTIFMALQDNDVYDWAPEAPTRIYFCGADEQVTPLNGQIAINTMNDNGAPDVMGGNLDESADHEDCATPALVSTTVFFNGFQNIVSSNNDIVSNNGLYIYPNPARDYMILEDNHQSNGDIRVFDSMGKVVLQSQYRSGENLALSDLIPGNYYVMWQTKNQTYSHRIIKL